MFSEAIPVRFRAGAPVPTRSMSREELLDNLRYFTEGLEGPRTQPCSGLVLSGVGVATRPDIPEAIERARSLGIAWVVMHVGGEDLDDLAPARFVGLVDTLVTPVQPENGTLVKVCETIARARGAGLKVAANTVLTANALPSLGRAARPLAKAAPDSMTFTYPFPINGNEATSAPNPGRVMSALRPALAGSKPRRSLGTNQGTPCHLGRDAHRLGQPAIVTTSMQIIERRMRWCSFRTLFGSTRTTSADSVLRTSSVTTSSRPTSEPGFPPLRPVEDVTPTTRSLTTFLTRPWMTAPIRARMK